MNRPKWTILYNIDCGEFIGTGWEFYNDDREAQQRYEVLSSDTRTCPTKRPYHEKTDFPHFGAATKTRLNYGKS